MCSSDLFVPAVGIFNPQNEVLRRCLGTTVSLTWRGRRNKICISSLNRLIIHMLTSKELLEKTGISRATLNNYVARGLLPRPVVASPELRGGKRPRQIGYFPDEALGLVEQILRWKAEGLSMDEIMARTEARPGTDTSLVAQAAPGGAQVISHPATLMKKQPLVVTIDQMPHPAYMVNHRFEVVWFNDK